MLNKVILMGRLVDEPELKKTPAGVSVVTARIAVERDYKGKDGERPADFPTVIFWRSTAEFVDKYFHKGSMIAVVGAVQTRTYQTKDGKSRVATEIVAENVSFTGEKRDGNSNHPQNQYTAPQQSYQQQGTVPQQSYQQQTSVPQQAVQQQSAPQQNTISDGFEEMPLLSDDDLPF